jgi:hypothetical protein
MNTRVKRKRGDEKKKEEEEKRVKRRIKRHGERTDKKKQTAKSWSGTDDGWGSHPKDHTHKHGNERHVCPHKV